MPRLRLAWRLDHGACPRRLARCGRQAPRFTPPAPPPRAPPPIAPPYLGSAREALRHLEHLNKGRISVPLAPPPSTAAPPLRGRFAACVSSAVHLSTTAALTRSFSEAGAPRSAAHCSASSCISSHVSRPHPASTLATALLSRARSSSTSLFSRCAAPAHVVTSERHTVEATGSEHGGVHTAQSRAQGT